MSINTIGSGLLNNLIERVHLDRHISDLRWGP